MTPHVSVKSHRFIKAALAHIRTCPPGNAGGHHKSPGMYRVQRSARPPRGPPAANLDLIESFSGVRQLVGRPIWATRKWQSFRRTTLPSGRIARMCAFGSQLYIRVNKKLCALSHIQNALPRRRSVWNVRRLTARARRGASRPESAGRRVKGRSPARL